MMRQCADFLCSIVIVLVSPGGATASAGGVLNLVSSFVFFPLVVLSVSLFLSLPL